MQLENSFAIKAPPDRVFAYLVDPHNVVGCVPGAELTEEVDAATFKGRVKIKVGPITVAYAGTGKIVERDDVQRMAVIEAEGRETTGPGSGRGKATMTVAADAEGSLVKIVTEYTLTGRVAQFGRGVIEDVSRKMVRDVADCIQANLQAPQAGNASATSPDTGEPPRPSAPAVAGAKPVNAAALLFSVLWDRIKSLFGGQPR